MRQVAQRGGEAGRHVLDDLIEPVPSGDGSFGVGFAEGLRATGRGGDQDELARRAGEAERATGRATGGRGVAATTAGGRRARCLPGGRGVIDLASGELGREVGHRLAHRRLGDEVHGAFGQRVHGAGACAGEKARRDQRERLGLAGA